MLFALSLEKAPVRREAAQIAAMRSVQSAKLEALDRIGRELGVPRFTDVLSYDPTSANRSSQVSARRELP